MDYSEMLGLYFGERKLGAWLQELEIDDEPVLHRGEINAYLSRKPAGIELTFSDSESLKDAERDYPDGALVLTNIRFYGPNADEFSAFKGPLPSDIAFGQTASDLVSKLGEPEWTNPRGNRLRWNMGRYRLHVTLLSDARVGIASVGLPI